MTTEQDFFSSGTDIREVVGISWADIDAMTDWRKKNFPDTDSTEQFMGMVEEMGELSHAILKRKQGIRTNEDHDAAIVDAIGDIFIYMVNFCDLEGIDVVNAVHEAWFEVEQREWRKNPETGIESSG